MHVWMAVATNCNPTISCLDLYMSYLKHVDFPLIQSFHHQSMLSSPSRRLDHRTRGFSFTQSKAELEIPWK